jgi:hypothetical protein
MLRNYTGSVQWLILKVFVSKISTCDYIVYTRKNAQVCYKSVYKLLTRYIRTACHNLSTGLEQLVDNL